MPSLNLDSGYFGHPKTLRLIGLLGLGAEAYPLRLWCHAATYEPETGCFKHCSATELESFAQWHGQPGELVNALMKTGFIEQTDSSYQIHDWHEHAGHIIAFKKRAKTAAKKRWGKYTKSTAPSNAKGKAKQCPSSTVLAKQILTYLNTQTGSDFREVSANLDPIKARLMSKVSVEQCEAVIQQKIKDWLHDDKMRKNLTPATLFRASNFEKYLGQLAATAPAPPLQHQPAPAAPVMTEAERQAAAEQGQRMVGDVLRSLRAVPPPE
jgi:uncharacterized phage protein (TIGR02220 family)